MKQVEIYTPYIKLGQMLKLVDLISTGGEEKIFIATNKIYVNGELEDRRGRKLYENDVVKVGKEEFLIKNADQ